MMRATVMDQPGGPEVLTLKEVPKPEPAEGRVLIRIRAFGLNRAVRYTSDRHSGASVKFPRINIGIECVGEVVAAPITRFVPGQRVAAIMSGMRRSYDRSYAHSRLNPPCTCSKSRPAWTGSRSGRCQRCFKRRTARSHRDWNATARAISSFPVARPPSA